MWELVSLLNGISGKTQLARNSIKRKGKKFSRLIKEIEEIKISYSEGES